MKNNNVTIEHLERNAMADARQSALEFIADHPSGVKTDETLFGNDSSLLRSASFRPPGR